MGHLGAVLYEYLGEEYPEVLGSILGALKAIVNVIGMTKMTPPIKDLLPRLTPISSYVDPFGPSCLLLN
jgi:splicing factor 3B subunit 1